MTTFLLDLWQDLRAKRLWPVAVALLAATVAVPVVLFKPASSTPPPTGAGQASGSSKLPAVTLDASSIASSHLNIFKEKNPFAALKDPDTSQGSGSGGGATTTAAGTGSTSAATSGGGGSTTPAAGGSPTGGGTGTGSGTPTPTGPNGKPIDPGVHYFEYTADVRFGPRGQIKNYKGVHNLDVLPSGDNPVVAFMGVKNGKTAVFFIADPAFRADGEGKCQPSPDNCMFVYLTKDAGHDEETLSAQNGQVEYTLQLTGLHVETVSKAAVTGDTTPSSKRAAKRHAKARRATLLTMPAIIAKR
jgi:hypothetical protein